MAQTNINAIIVLKNGQQSAIAASTYVPSRGEPVVDIENKLMYIGDGSTQLQNLEPINVSSDELTEQLASYIKNNSYATTSTAGIVKVDGVELIVGADGALSIGTIDASKIQGDISSVEKLAEARDISSTGDVTWTVSFDGSQNVSGEATLASVGTAGTYTKVTTDAKGRVTSGETTIATTDITGLGDLATKDTVTSADLDETLSQKIQNASTASEDALKSVTIDDNTISFYTNAEHTGAAAFTVDLPAEYFLDQAQTKFVQNFAWSEETYPGSEDPSLNGKPVLVLAVKADDSSSVTYSFLDMSALTDVYTGEDGQTVTVAVSDFEISATVKVSQTAGNQIQTQADGLYVAATDVSGKMDLVASATAGHVATLTATGQAQDSGFTIGTSVPADAKFTDTTYEPATSSANGLMTSDQFKKLEGIQAGAEANVNADWNAGSGDAQILNKPTNVSAFANDANYFVFNSSTDTLVLNGGTVASN